MVRARALEAAGLGAGLGIAAWLFSGTLHQAANFDEGVYLASVDALRHGQELGKDVFPDQPPGFYLLLQGIAAAFGDSVHGVRVGFLCISLLGVAAAYACARAFGGWQAGLAAAALLVVAAPYPSEAALVEADPPAVVLCLVALALAAWSLVGRERPSLAFLAGVAFAAAVSVKLLALPVVLPIAALLIARRASGRAVLAAVAGALLVPAVLVAVYADSLHQIWTGVVSVHTRARNLGPSSPTGNVDRIIHFFDLRTPFGWLTIAGVLTAGLLTARRARPWWPLWTWPAASLVFLLIQKPLADHHFVLLAAALALPVGVVLVDAFSARQGVVFAGAAVVFAAFLAAGVYQEHRRIVRNAEGEPTGVTWAARRLQAETHSRDLVSTDLPIVAFLAKRRIPGGLIDTSVGRIGSGFLKPRDILRMIDETHVRAVVIGRFFEHYPKLVSAISVRFPRHASRAGVTVYFR